jgi:hypothetical protein
VSVQLPVAVLLCAYSCLPGAPLQPQTQDCPLTPLPGVPKASNTLLGLQCTPDSPPSDQTRAPIQKLKPETQGGLWLLTFPPPDSDPLASSALLMAALVLLWSSLFIFFSRTAGPFQPQQSLSVPSLYRFHQGFSRSHFSID